MPKKYIGKLQEYVNNYRKNIEISLKSTKKFLETAENNYLKIRKENATSEMRISEKNIKRLTDKCNELQDILDRIESREIYDELEEKMNEEEFEREEKERIHELKLKMKRKHKEEDQKILDKSYKKERNIRRKLKWEEKDLQKEYNRFERNANSLPNYMKRNLKEMPNNKGYIWKNIRFYGELPAQKGQPDILFEKTRGNIMFIHEITQIEHKIFEKKGRERKTFHSSTRIKNKNDSNFNLLDYVKK